nr:poly(U)-specific endoribonuclease-like [Ciona intestinalis]|eukprot:XP_002124119.3 poly(U)-specific endoribonuclease-like [Ciona intestinalis]
MRNCIQDKGVRHSRLETELQQPTMKIAVILFLVALAGQGYGDSCVGRCNDYADHSHTCECNSYCDTYGDCCPDYISTCLPTSTCAGRCGNSLNLNDPCHCNAGCENFYDCCADYATVCASGGGSGGSCSGRCGDLLDSSMPCQCNSQCENHGDCCSDYNSICNSGGGGDGGNTGSCNAISVSNSEIQAVSLEMWDLDVNRAGPGDIILNPQATTSDSSTVDNSPEPFFTAVNPAVLQQPTYQALIALLDNYQKVEGIDEVSSPQEEAEQDNFLDLFVETAVGARLYDFLQSKNLAGCADIATFKDYLKRMWFGFYSRQNNAMDTSGFEHVFVGEIKTNQVSGFHNWVELYSREQDASLNYYGYVGMTEPNLYGVHFSWDGYMKGLSGSSIGTSPEMDLALFTLCHMTRPAAQCTVNIRTESGSVVSRPIQTWTWTKTYPGDGLKYVASAYFLV